MDHIFLAGKETQYFSPQMSKTHPGNTMARQNHKCASIAQSWVSGHSHSPQRRLRWLGHVHRMPQGRLPQDILYGELPEGRRPTGRPTLRYVDVLKRDMKHLHNNSSNWEREAQDRPTWRANIKGTWMAVEDHAEGGKRAANSKTPVGLLCALCDRSCASNIGLFNHERSCKGKRSSRET